MQIVTSSNIINCTRGQSTLTAGGALGYQWIAEPGRLSKRNRYISAVISAPGMKDATIGLGLLTIISLFAAFPARAATTATDTLWRLPIDTAQHSTARQEALQLLKDTKLPDSSAWWPNIKGHLFIDNLIANINYPLKIYQGSNTNFCGYAAFSYLPLQDNPIAYTRFMITLYLTGEATWNNIVFHPSEAIHQAAGTLRFKGILDIRPADQLWFLMLADHFRSYLNFFTRRFKPGSENTFWAACNYGKFNRMIRQMLGWNVQARGSDIIRAHVHNLYDYLTKCLQSGTTYLYVNNLYLHKKNHNKFRTSFPTHFIVLERISRLPGDGDRVDIVYWDYGGRTLRQVDIKFLKKIIFGISHCTPPDHS